MGGDPHASDDDFIVLPVGGTIVLKGPQSVVVTCTQGLDCTITVELTSSATTNVLLVLANGETCGPGAAAVTFLQTNPQVTRRLV